ncbi:DUF58 domain-containing protein [Halobellus sp. GM3]|uniref:DUF58 domain-containing protein n=1 Tax=Halobellus sp. GM3 TaxID=3458410 RepID=UPI00403DE342
MLLGIGVVLIAWSILLAKPLILLGAVAIGAYLWTAQYQFIAHVREIETDIIVDQSLDRKRVTAEEATTGTLRITTETPTPVSITSHLAAPLSSDAPDVTCELPVGERTVEKAFTVTWPVAGKYEFEKPTVTVTDRQELFQHSIQTGTTPSVTVEPRAQSTIHVGEGGTQLTAGFGEHDTGRTGSGTKPAELRQYNPGDATKQIDWKATARLAEPYVREFEAQTDVETELLVDHQHTMGDGPPGETKLIFARQVALAIVASAQEFGDPLGCYTVGDAGFTNTFSPGTTARHYQRITESLQELIPTTPVDAQLDQDAADPSWARRTAANLPDDETFGERLRPFFATPDAYVLRMAERPLFQAARLATARNSGSTRTVIFTDDEDRTTLRETVKVARRGEGQVLVYLTPSTLFTDTSLRDVDLAYQRYTEFEQFRRDLTTLPRVKAFEVGPSDRLARILAAGSRTRQRRVES